MLLIVSCLPFTFHFTQPPGVFRIWPHIYQVFRQLRRTFWLFLVPGTAGAERSAARIAFANGIRGGYDNIYVTNK